MLEAGPVPENFTGPLRRFQPELVLLVDAALMGEAPGALRHLDWKEAAGFSSSSHTLPLETFASYLVGELGCEVQLLGVQPGDNDLEAPFSARGGCCERAVEWIEASIGLSLPWKKRNCLAFSEAVSSSLVPSIIGCSRSLKGMPACLMCYLPPVLVSFKEPQVSHTGISRGARQLGSLLCFEQAQLTKSSR